MHLLVGDMHPIRDDDAEFDSPPRVANVRAQSAANARLRQDAEDGELTSSSAVVAAALDSEYTALARRFYRMTPRCTDDDGDVDVQHAERLTRADTDGDDVDGDAQHGR